MSILKNLKVTTLALGFGAMFGGCGDDVGDAQIFLAPEETIPGGIQSGAGEENIVDGWSVEYDRFVVNIGGFSGTATATGDTASIDGFFIVDFKTLDEAGINLGNINEIAAVRYDKTGYTVKAADASSQVLGTPAQADVDTMKSEGLAFFISGKLIADAGAQVCDPGTVDCVAAPAEIPFEWKITQGAAWSDCEEEEGGNLGFAVPSGGTIQVKPTLHGDHPFFNNFTVGVELTERRAQYMADAAFAQIQAGGAVKVDLATLGGISAAAAFPAAIYTLTGSPLTIDSAADYVISQQMTSAHVNGEGECPTVTLIP